MLHEDNISKLSYFASEGRLFFSILGENLLCAQDISGVFKGSTSVNILLTNGREIAFMDLDGSLFQEIKALLTEN